MAQRKLVTLTTAIVFVFLAIFTSSCNSPDPNIAKIEASSIKIHDIRISIRSYSYQYERTIKAIDKTNADIAVFLNAIVGKQEAGEVVPQADFDTLRVLISKAKTNADDLAKVRGQEELYKKREIDALNAQTKYVVAAGINDRSPWFQKYVSLTKAINEGSIQWNEKSMIRSEGTARILPVSNQAFEQALQLLMKANTTDIDSVNAAAAEYTQNIETFKSTMAAHVKDSKAKRDELDKLSEKLKSLVADRQALIETAKKDGSLGDKEPLDYEP